MYGEGEKFEGLCAELARLQAETLAAWDTAVDTAESAARRAAAEADRESALGEWDAALAAVHSGDVASAIAALERASHLGMRWGDNGPEQAALRLLEAEPWVAVTTVEETEDGTLDWTVPALPDGWEDVPVAWRTARYRDWDEMATVFIPPGWDWHSHNTDADVGECECAAWPWEAGGGGVVVRCRPLDEEEVR